MLLNSLEELWCMLGGSWNHETGPVQFLLLNLSWWTLQLPGMNYHLVKRALGDLVDQIIYCTDFTFALSWCRNPKIKLRLFVYNRVMTILRMCEWTTGKAEVPLFHFDGKLHLSDLLTKHHEMSVEAVSLKSKWQTGLPWMRLDTDCMPLLEFD